MSEEITRTKQSQNRGTLSQKRSAGTLMIHILRLHRSNRTELPEREFMPDISRESIDNQSPGRTTEGVQKD